MKLVNAQYSPIAPISILEDLESRGVLGNYLLLLAQDVFAHESRYIQLLHKVRDRHSGEGFVILDNGAVELGSPVLPKDLEGIAIALKVDCYVLPDVLGDMMGTLQLLQDSLEDIRRIGIPIMRVPQGDTSEQVVRCIEAIMASTTGLCNHPKYGELWSVPRWIANKFGSRLPTIQFINNFAHEPSIHLLGMSTQFKDDIRATSLPNVIGIDSANPVVLGLAQKNMGISFVDGGITHDDRADLWQRTEATSCVVDNMQFVRHCILTADLERN
ncbi:MAG: hypothetical protein COA78_31405 [Blastopirellula sp.]|nr:MAG: hypothetical protein COA78_31405 [Blastopirellula sp.]